MDKRAVIAAAVKWLDVNGVELSNDLVFCMGLAAKFNVGQDLNDIQNEYNTKLYGVMDDYSSSTKPITSFRNEYKRVVYEGFIATARAAWIDAGNIGPIPDTLVSYVNERFARETEYIDDLFKRLRDLRKTGTTDELASFIQQRADGYTATLEGVNNYALMDSQSEVIGIWRYGDTVAHCQTCSDLEGERHPLSWFIANGYIPRQKGSATLECGGWNCECRIEDENGKQLI